MACSQASSSTLENHNSTYFKRCSCCSPNPDAYQRTLVAQLSRQQADKITICRPHLIKGQQPVPIARHRKRRAKEDRPTVQKWSHCIGRERITLAAIQAMCPVKGHDLCTDIQSAIILHAQLSAVNLRLHLAVAATNLANRLHARQQFSHGLCPLLDRVDACSSKGTS